jgi:hypothetical protein
MSAAVVQLSDYRRKPKVRRRRKSASQYELYPLPFFNAKARCTWDVKPTGNYSEDCETGHAYAVEFLKSCDGTIGWSTLLGQVIGDMIRAGPTDKYASGEPKCDGVVIGFTRKIGAMVSLAVQIQRAY